MAATTMLPIDRISPSRNFSARAERPSPEVVRDFAEAMADAELPPILCYDVGGEIVLVDGWTRLMAARELGRSAIAAEVRVGGRREARVAGAASNLAHGVRRSVADKRKAVLTVLEEQPEWAVAKVASTCGVSVSLVVGIVEVRRRMPAVPAAEVADKGPREVLGKPRPTPKPAPAKPAAAPVKPPAAVTLNPWQGVLDRDRDDEEEDGTPPPAAPAPTPPPCQDDEDDEDDEAEELDHAQALERCHRSCRKYVRFARELGLDLHRTLDEVVADMVVRAAREARRGRPERPKPAPLQPAEQAD